MSETTDTIVEAAVRMFSRYGYAKTTMGDIAAEAGVSRQTVYNIFPGKDELLRAVVRQANVSTLAAVRTAWSETDDFEMRLRLFQEMAPVSWFEAVKSAPDWGALMEGMHSAAAEEIREMRAVWDQELRAVFRDSGRVPSSETSLDEVADFFHSASLNAKYGVDDVAELRRRLETIRIATLSLLPG